MKIIKADENRRAFSALKVSAKPTALLFKTSSDSYRAISLKVLSKSNQSLSFFL